MYGQSIYGASDGWGGGVTSFSKRKDGDRMIIFFLPEIAGNCRQANGMSWVV
jgi:hypothetical protein